MSCQRSSPSVPPSSSLPSHVSSPDTEILKELQAIRAEILTLKQENAALRRENSLLKQQLHTRPAIPSVQLEQPTPASQDVTTPPPIKRKATANTTTSDATSSLSDDRIAGIEIACKTALAEQKEEYLKLHQILLSNQGAMQATIESLRAEIHNCLRGIVATTGDHNLPQNTPLPPSELEDV